MQQPQGASIWGNINTCVEIALNVYYIYAEHGEGIVIGKEKADQTVSAKAIEALSLIHIFTVAEPVKGKTKKEMVLPSRDRNNNRAALYLISDRKLDEDIVYALMDQGRIFQVRQEINGKKYINCAFVGYDQENTPRYCSLREMKLHGGFRQDIENSDKTYGFLMPGRSKRVYEFEAPIDAISHATLCKRFGIDWTKDYRISEG